MVKFKFDRGVSDKETYSLFEQSPARPPNRGTIGHLYGSSRSVERRSSHLVAGALIITVIMAVISKVGTASGLFNLAILNANVVLQYLPRGYVQL